MDSSPAATREFCRACGTPLFFRVHVAGHLVDVTLASLDEPGRVTPEYPL